MASFDPAVVMPGSSSTLTISNLAGLFGSYSPVVRGTSTSGIKEAAFPVSLLAPPGTAPTLTSPANNTTDEVITPILDWQPVSNIFQYEYQLAFDSDFSLIALSGLVTTDRVQITSPLVVGSQYFWRVRAVNGCGSGGWSTTFNFTTVSCFALNSTNVPVVIPPSGTPTVFSTFTNGIEMVIEDVNIIDLQGAHSWVDDLKFSLISPDGTERLFWNRPCANHDDFNIQFDDEAGGGTWPCPPVNGLTYRPDNSLTVFDGEQAMGTWLMKIEDIQNQDGGSLNSWGLKVCGEISCQLTVNQVTGTGTGSLPAAINCAEAGDTIILSVQLAGLTIQIGDFPLLLGKDLVIMAQAPDISIATTGVRVFEVDQDTQVDLVGLNIIAGSSTDAGAVKNQGILNLTDVTIERNMQVTGAVLIGNIPGSMLHVEGNCSINQ
jgi:subtilisin-like proprotein convertase family protein